MPDTSAPIPPSPIPAAGLNGHTPPDTQASDIHDTETLVEDRDSTPSPDSSAGATPDPGMDFDTPEPFRVLGHNASRYFYLPHGNSQVVTLKAGGHTELCLLQLAPASWWSNRFPKKTGWDDKTAADWLIQRCHRVGIFDPERLCGRGAWFDRGRVIVHTGEMAFIDGEAVRPTKIVGDRIYFGMPRLSLNPEMIATTVDANRLVDICERLTWENPLSAQLLAGWCVIAPVCGLVPWRPHIWITGSAQSGKTSVKSEIVGRVVGPFAIEREGNTTEAAIRQRLGSDARPVIIDEFESESIADAARVQAILGLARVSSSGGIIDKGTQGGEAMMFKVQAAFAFFSINTSVSQYADETRISRLVLRPNDAPDAAQHYIQLMASIRTHLTPDFSSAMLGRSIKYARVLLSNCETFKQAASIVLRSRRAADQIGTMLAGLYLCHSTKAITAEAAEAWIRERNWGDHTAVDSANDEQRLLERLMTRRFRMTNGHGNTELTIGRALIDVHGKRGAWDDVAKELGALGLRVSEELVLVANSASPIAKMLEGSPWAKDWKRPLRSLPGAEAVETVYFAPGLRSRAVGFPIRMLMDDVAAGRLV